MDRQPHNNLWAEKLLQVSMPDSGQAWAGMEAILDRQMSQRFRSDRRRWLLLILLLLLLIGVCNCPGRGRLFHRSERGPRISGANPATPATPASTPASAASTPASPAAPGATPAGAHSPGGSANPETPANPANRVNPLTPATAAPTLASPAAPGATPSTPSKTPAAPSTPAAAATPKPEPTNPAILHGRSSPLAPASVTARKRNRPASKTQATASNHPATPGRTLARPLSPPVTHGPGGHKVKPSPHTPRLIGPALTATPTGPPPPTTFGDITTTAGNDSTGSGKPGRDTATKKNVTAARDTIVRKSTPALAKAVPRKDTAHKKPSPPPEDKDQKERDHGWVFGIGLNQFFPIGGQRGSTYNTDGLTGTLSDYLPVPMIRYYLNHKAYLQVEAQLNTPQATKKNLVFNSVLHDTTSIPGENVQTSATLQQLYYFNIPLSFHYAVTDDLNIGTGLQFSHLSNAIGNFDSTVTNLATLEVTNPKDTKSFKDDTLYRRIRTNEFRFLIDASYTWKHLVVGMRYNQALSKFIDVPLPTGGSTQSRNSSLQLYLRYILWDTRKKKSLTPE
jgi:hypothetical protein